MTKKTKILIIALFVGCFIVSSQVSAQGIIPCGQRIDNASTTVDESADCTLCHFFILIERVLEFVFFKLTPPLALLMLVIGGGMFMLAAGDPAKVTQARKIISSVLIGIAIIYGSFFLIGLFLQSIGLADWTTNIYTDWWENGIFNIDCPVPSTTMAPPVPPAPIPPIPPVAAFIPPVAPATMPIIIPIAQNFSSNAIVITFP